MLKKLQSSEDEILCYLIDEIADFECYFESHGDNEQLSEYKKEKESSDSWREYLLNWGKRMNWIQ